MLAKTAEAGHRADGEPASEDRRGSAIDLETNAGETATQANWRDALRVHPACAAFPELAPDELIALGDDIKANGLRLPIVVRAEGDASNPEFTLLDGRSRLDAMVAVGIGFKIIRSHCPLHPTFPSVCLNISGIGADAPGGNVQMALGHSETEIKALVLSLNALRRHLDAKGKRTAIEALLKLDPSKSDRQIAEQIGSSPTTVGKQRKKAEAAGDVSIMDTRTDKRGRKQPATKPAKAANPVEAAPEDDPDASAEKRKALNADDELSLEEKAATPEPKPGPKPAAAKASKDYLQWFAVACRQYLPYVTAEMHRQEARRLVAELTKAEAAP